MSPAEDINITITGARAEKIRAAHEISRARRLAIIDARIAQETNPEILEQLNLLRDEVLNEGVNKFILVHFKNMVMAEERAWKKRVLEDEAKAAIKQAIQDYLDQFDGI